MTGRQSALQSISQESRPVPRRYYDPQASAYPGDLRNVDQGYESAMGQLFQDFPLGLGGYARQSVQRRSAGRQKGRG